MAGELPARPDTVGTMASRPCRGVVPSPSRQDAAAWPRQVGLTVFPGLGLRPQGWPMLVTLAAAKKLPAPLPVHQ